MCSPQAYVNPISSNVHLLPPIFPTFTAVGHQQVIQKFTILQQDVNLQQTIL